MARTTDELKKTSAELVVDLRVERMRFHGIEKTLQLTSGGSTNTNTGCKEVLLRGLKENLAESVTEPSARSTHSSALDGPMTRNSFLGPIAKLLKDTKHKDKPKLPNHPRGA